ncbi:protein SENSITIVITY TO RED LIGHT REDUCED 1 [Lactuca sativa]|nr:protein SENSITIVITY TO RED LIGHT REDUCED 1 [Lactuca sativa]XP_023750976.1 protein SENSITIVITY TO RED LIGHT REDUCED 1 [Lactuca sativa]
MAASAETLKCEHHKTAEDDDWTIVLRKRTNPKRKFPKLKPSKQQQEQQQTQWAPTDIETTLEKELHLMNKMKISIEKLEKSQFFNAFLDQIHTPEASQHFLKLTQSQSKVKMVIYGIGSIESFESPRLQLSLAILMKRKLDWIGEMEVFDPIISLTESKVMVELGCRVLLVNEHGRREAVDPILFFMPHCEVELYDNLLKTNWRHDLLNKIILLGNSFEKYEHHRLVSKNQALDESRKHLLAIQEFTKEFEIKTLSDDYFRAFHGSSWHFFSVDCDTDLQLTC